MTVEARELYSSSMGPMVSGSRTPFRANAHRARAERSLWRRIDAADGGVGRGILACLATTIVRNLLQGQYERPVRVVALNADEGWARDVSDNIAAAQGGSSSPSPRCPIKTPRESQS